MSIRVFPFIRLRLSVTSTATHHQKAGQGRRTSYWTRLPRVRVPLVGKNCSVACSFGEGVHGP